MTEQKKAELKTTLIPDNIKIALLNPGKSAEVKIWLKNNKEAALSWRGEDGESMIHWAFLSDWVLASDLRDLGQDFNTVDNNNRKPMDWLLDRLWLGVVQRSGASKNISLGSVERIKKHSEQQIISLWRLGARPSINNTHPGVVWMRAGCFSLLSLIDPDESAPFYENDITGWLNWLPKDGSALHAWVLSPNNPGKIKFLESWLNKKLNIDVTDSDGRTPLWYASEALRIDEHLQPEMLKTIKILLENGADLDVDDDAGFTPRLVLMSANIKDEVLSLELKKIINL